MKRILIFILFCSFPAFGDSLPRSIELWKNDVAFFESLDIRSARADTFKSSLSDYYREIYAGAPLEKKLEWIEVGKLGGHYFTSHYWDRRNTKFYVLRKSSTDYEVEAIRNSCYYAPRFDGIEVESIVSDLKISNITQPQIKDWIEMHKSLKVNAQVSASLCLKHSSKVAMKLNEKNLINLEEWETVNTKVSLAPPIGQDWKTYSIPLACGLATIPVAQTDSGCGCYYDTKSGYPFSGVFQNAGTPEVYIDGKIVELKEVKDDYSFSGARLGHRVSQVYELQDLKLVFENTITFACPEDPPWPCENTAFDTTLYINKSGCQATLDNIVGGCGC